MNIVIGIAGGTGAGKTALVGELARRLGGCVVEVDAYYHDRTGMPPEDRRRLNYDEPAAIDQALLVDHLARLARGEAVAKPVYSFESHTRVGERRLAPASLVIVEGLFTWWWAEVRHRLVCKIFIDAPVAVRLSRRLQRDIAQRGRTPEQVMHQYLTTVLPMHDRYVEPCRLSADLLVDNEGPLDETVKACVDGMAVHLRRRPSCTLT